MLPHHYLPEGGGKTTTTTGKDATLPPSHSQDSKINAVDKTTEESVERTVLRPTKANKKGKYSVNRDHRTCDDT